MSSCRIAITGMLLVALAAPCAAQGVRAGLKGGAAFTSLSNIFVVTEGDEEESSVHNSPTFGGFVELSLAPHVSFQPEVLFATIGAVLPETSAGSAVLVRYLDVPLLLKIGGAPDRPGVFVVAGPTFALKLDASLADGDEDIDDRIKRTNWSVTIGLGVQARRWLLEARFSQGLRTIATDDVGEPPVKSKAVAVLAGVRF
jgi:outer membrane protein with beta-barrel domain